MIDYNRCKKIIEEAITLLQLNLKGLTILTEVASGLFVFTPVIAALAGSKKVLAVVNDSAYGSADNIIEDCLKIADRYGINKSIFSFAKNSVPKEFLESADIITNSGHLRPLDEEKLSLLKKNAVIPIMYEKWELRESDINIPFCEKKGIKTGGTWENHPSLKIFDYCTHLMLKLIFEAGYEINGNKIIVFSSDHYGVLLQKACLSLGASSVIITSDSEKVMADIDNTDFIFFCDYNNCTKLIVDSSQSAFNLHEIYRRNNSVGIIHLTGNIDNEFVKRGGLSIYPDKKGESQRMTHTLAYLGPRPILMLQAAGLKVGEELYQNKCTSLTQL